MGDTQIVDVGAKERLRACVSVRVGTSDKGVGGERGRGDGEEHMMGVMGGVRRGRYGPVLSGSMFARQANKLRITAEGGGKWKEFFLCGGGKETKSWPCFARHEMYPPVVSENGVVNSRNDGVLL